MAPRDFDLMARAGTIDDVKSTLSSWDSCMAKSYCKYVLPLHLQYITLEHR